MGNNIKKYDDLETEKQLVNTDRNTENWSYTI
jgi:hypothetical protein